MAQTEQKSERQQLLELIRKYSVRRGEEITLASGAKTNVYIDCRLTTCRAEGIRLVGNAIISKVRELGWKPEAVGGLVIGADPVVIAVARQSLETDAPINAFLVRKEIKKHGMQRSIEGLQQTQGVKALIVDDVCTSGGSTITAIERAREAGMEVVGAMCLVDRKAGGGEAIEALGCPFAAIYTMDEVLAE